MLTSKQRAFLRSAAHSIDPAFQYGKEGISENFAVAVNSYLDAHEIIKISVLDNSEYSPSDSAEIIAEATDSEIVCIVGRKVVLYKKSRDRERRNLSVKVAALGKNG